MSFIGALSLSFLHLGGQGAAILAIYWWARQMEQNGTVSVPLLGIQFAARDEPAFLWAVMIFSAFCLMAGACSLFISRVLVLNIVRDNYAQSLDRMAFFASRLPDPRARAASQLLLRYGLKALVIGCRRVALTAIEFANAIPAVMGGAGAAAFLFGVDPLLTLSILLASVSGAVLLYPLALRGANVTKHLQQAQIAFKSEIRRLKRTQALSPLKLKTSNALAQASLASRRVRTELSLRNRNWCLRHFDFCGLLSGKRGHGKIRRVGNFYRLYWCAALGVGRWFSCYCGHCERKPLLSANHALLRFRKERSNGRQEILRQGQTRRCAHSRYPQKRSRHRRQRRTAYSANHD